MVKEERTKEETSTITTITSFTPLYFNIPRKMKFKSIFKVIFLATILLVLCSTSLSFAQVQPAQPAKPEGKTGPNNSIIDVPGIEVGNYTDPKLTGTTVILCRKSGVGGVDVRGSAPGTRETDLLNPINLVDKVNAIVLTGGSAYGLAAADGVMLWLEEKGLGWPVGRGNVVPIVPAAVLFDPGRFGRSFQERPTAYYGMKACENAQTGVFLQGNVGAGAGAISGGLKGGLGTASVDLGNGVIVGAIVAVNSVGSTVNPYTGEFYAAYLEIGNEFGDLKRPFAMTFTNQGVEVSELLQNPQIAQNTTIAVIATNTQLTKSEAQKIAEMANDGIARAIRPSHTMFDGDTIFVIATGELPTDVLMSQAAWGNKAANVMKIGAAAADTLARAIVHAMLNAQTVGDVASYRDKYPGAFK